MRASPLSLVSFSLALAAHAKLLTDPGQLTSSEYDYVVVGGGTAGSVIANRLSENPRLSILVIEAGINNAGITPTMVPYLASTLQSNDTLFWNYNTVPQSALDNRVIPYQRGRMLGGSSSVNFLIYTRGSRDDFDSFASLSGDSGWSWDNMFPYMLKAEGFTIPVDNHDTFGQFVPLVHGFEGPLRTSLPGFRSTIDGRVISTTQTDPERFPFNLDPNSGDTVGISWVQSTSGLGQRSSAATAYLQPAMQRPNLDVLINTQVTRLTSTATQNHISTREITARRRAIPDLRVVEFAQSSTGPRRTVRARREVVLSAGAVNTPQLLLLSGVGDAMDLSALGIPVIVDSPGVGQNLQDHPLLSNQWLVNSNNTLDPLLRNKTQLAEWLQQWQTTKTGQFTDTVVNHFAWLRIPPDSGLFNDFDDPTPGPTSAHIELLPGNQFVSFLEPNPQNGSFVSIITNVVSPASRGSVRLTSTNPFDFPAIDPGFMTHPLDVKIMVEAIRTSSDFLATEPWKDFAPKPWGDLANAKTDEELAAYMRRGIMTFWHPSCTAKMGYESDPMAVVDAELRLKGAKGVRIVDASVFPFIPSSHLQAPVYAIAERAADLIKNRENEG